MSEPKYVDGLYPRPKSDRAPNYVIGKLSINVVQFKQWLEEWERENPAGQWINIDMTTRKSDPSKGTAKLDIWKPDSSKGQSQTRQQEAAGGGAMDDDVPFSPYMHGTVA